MKMGNKTVNYSFYAEINSSMQYINDTTSIQLPSFENASDEIKGAGIMGAIDWPTYLSPGASTFSYNVRQDDAQHAYLSAPGKKRFEIRWVTDKFDTSNVNIGVDVHKVVIVAVPKKYDPGKIETGSTSDGSGEFEVLYFKKTLNGVEVIEIDKLNYIFRVNGVDYGADIRNSL